MFRRAAAAAAAARHVPDLPILPRRTLTANITTPPPLASFPSHHRRRTLAAMTDSNTNQYSEILTPAKLEASLKHKLDAPYVAVEDISGGCGQSFEAIVVSDQFDKKTTLARHRLVNSALKEEIALIHAWTAKCYTPEQWEKVKAERGV